jgi:hypothetical protein
MKSPFKFLDPYAPKDKNIFFGRDQEIKELYSMVFQTSLMLVYGLSGTGKTSLVQCGLAGKFDGPEWHPFFIRWQNDINESIAQTFKPLLSGEHESLTKSVTDIYENYFRPVYLIFDQFEEIFILGTHEERQKFVREIKELLAAHIPCKVIIVMREEYIGQLYAFEKEIPTLLDFRFRVERMGTTKVKEVIASTFNSFNVHIEEPEDKLLDQMIMNINDEKSGIALPYLQVYMDVLYQAGKTDPNDDSLSEGGHPNILISKKNIEDVGKIEDVLDQFLNQQVNVIDKNIQAAHPTYKKGALAALLDAFVTEDGTKRPIPYMREEGQIVFSASENDRLPSLSSEVMVMAIDGLEKSRLLRVSDDSIELAHDSLAALIDQRRSDEQRSLNNIKKRLVNEYNEYLISKEPLSKKQLLSFEEYIPILNLDREVLDFIHFSEKQATKKEQEVIEQKRKELEVEQEMQKAELLAAKNRAEKAKIEADKKVLAAGKKARRWRNAMAVVAVMLLGFVAYTLYKQKTSLSSENVIIKKQKDKIDSLNTKLTTANGALSEINQTQEKMISNIRGVMVSLDGMIMGEESVDRNKIVKSGLYIKGYLEGKTENMIASKADYAFVLDDNFFTSDRDLTKRSKSARLPKPDTLFRINETVWVYMGFRTTKKNENVSLKIIQPDGSVVEFNQRSGSFKQIVVDKPDVSNVGFRVSRAFTPKIAGNYKVTLENQGGYTWERTFSVVP